MCAVDAPEVGANLQDHYQARVIVQAEGKALAQRRRAQPAAAGADGRAMAVRPARAADRRRRPGRRPGRHRTCARRARRRAVQRDAAVGRQAGRSRCTASRAFRRRPRSAGPNRPARVEIASADPLALPRIRAGYLTEPLDAKVLVAGLRIAARDLCAAVVPRPGHRRRIPAGQRRGHAGGAGSLCARQGRHRVPPDQHLPHGRRRRARWSTSGCACAASTGCAWSTRR